MNQKSIKWLRLKVPKIVGGYIRMGNFIINGVPFTIKDVLPHNMADKWMFIEVYSQEVSGLIWKKD